MQYRFTLVFIYLLSTICHAGFFAFIGTGYDNVKEKLKLTQVSNSESYSGLSTLVGFGFMLQPSEAFSMPVSVEVAYSTAKSSILSSLNNENKLNSVGAIIVRPTLNAGWLGGYALIGIGQINFTQIYNSADVSSEIKKNVNNPVLGAGIRLKLDKDIDAYAELQTSKVSLLDIYGLNTNSNASEKGAMKLDQGRYLVGVRYFL